MKVYIGFDSAEIDAYAVAQHSMQRRSSVPLEFTPLIASRLRSSGLVTRDVDARGGMYDLASQAPQATEFANTRFIVPLLAQSGPALFIDCDMLVMADVAELFREFDSSKAVQVVKHAHNPVEKTKMNGAPQTAYSRKNWSSVILWNCDHPANRRLTLSMINDWPGRDLHNFLWLADAEIGELSPRWNWLVNVQPRPAADGIAHFTLGGPWLPGWKEQPFDELWLQESRR